MRHDRANASLGSSNAALYFNYGFLDYDCGLTKRLQLLCCQMRLDIANTAFLRLIASQQSDYSFYVVRCVALHQMHHDFKKSGCVDPYLYLQNIIVMMPATKNSW